MCGHLTEWKIGKRRKVHPGRVTVSRPKIVGGGGEGSVFHYQVNLPFKNAFENHIYKGCILVTLLARLLLHVVLNC